MKPITQNGELFSALDVYSSCGLHGSVARLPVVYPFVLYTGQYNYPTWQKAQRVLLLPREE
jgi:hypothetical protein